MYEIIKPPREMPHYISEIDYGILVDELNDKFNQEDGDKKYWIEKDTAMYIENRKGLKFLILNWIGEGVESKNKYLKTNEKVKNIVKNAKEKTEEKEKGYCYKYS